MSNLEQYNKLRAEFEAAHEIIPSRWSNYQAHITVLLLLVSFISLSAALVNRKSGAISYFSSAVVASGAIALGSIYACNFFGVYI
ncbi:hypothetical protein EJF18_20656 [Clavispora lusitaniae]|uniref:Uncharacterized protein n=2 Tax=Clavispora lusitaniae TaxID=36911 RepID=A0ACD0WHV0_CLALS|nr:hypothetical protein A9F13_02g04389 [Clavispora lusitaniae]QFZ26738.1 hypothetical protein EJF14_20656 [Clavispora lusitaniae]QFZ32406.1 hypothetical protein EJF16_20656 [Clavispora lusitaniae]QFZ38075.1 hypothetical protein EJF15_20656 [Clavispora lusitaniae]QFZ43758.1 hypothetical protein EJF18_20656 [Clavispora lusitaniae]